MVLKSKRFKKNAMYLPPLPLHGALGGVSYPFTCIKQWKEMIWSIPFYAPYPFPWQYIYLPLSIFKAFLLHHFLFLNLHYYITIYQNDDLQKITSLTNSEKVSILLIVFKTLHHHFFVFCSDRSLMCHCFNYQLPLESLHIIKLIHTNQSPEFT